MKGLNSVYVVSGTALSTLQ